MSEHVSPETAKRLKSAGLAWEPRVGDWCQDEISGEIRLVVEVEVLNGLTWVLIPYRSHVEFCLFLPRADDLLRELKGMECSVMLDREPDSPEWSVHVGACQRWFYHEHLVEALAAALLAAKEGR